MERRQQKRQGQRSFMAWFKEIIVVIESTAKGTTGPEEVVETTIGMGGNTGNSSEQSPADKLLLVEWGGLGIMYNQNKNQRRAREQRTNTTWQ